MSTITYLIPFILPRLHLSRHLIYLGCTTGEKGILILDRDYNFALDVLACSKALRQAISPTARFNS